MLASSFLSRKTVDAEGSAGAESAQPSEKGASSKMASPVSLEKAAASVTGQLPGRPRKSAGEGKNKSREKGNMPPTGSSSPGSLLHLAAKNGDVRSAKKQLALGADVNLFAPCPGSDGASNSDNLCSPLMLAIANEYPEVVRILLENGAHVASICPSGETIVHHAIATGNCEIVRLLLDADPARVETPNSNDISPLFMAAGGGRDELVGILLSSGAQVDRAGANGKTALVAATIFGHVKCVQLLLRAGADASKADSGGYNALQWAAHTGRVDLVEIFLNGGAAPDINKVYTITEDTLLIRASIKGHLDLVKFLLQRGADPFSVGADGVLLHLAKDLPIFRALLEHNGPQATAFVDSKGNTLFHHAVLEDRAGAFMCLLFKAGLDPRIENKLGATAADVARHFGQIDTAKLLEAFAAKYRDKESVGSIAVAASGTAGGGVVEAAQKLSSIVLSNADEKAGESVASSRSTEELEASAETEQRARILEPESICNVKMPSMLGTAAEKVEESSKNSIMDEAAKASVEASKEAKVKRRHRKVQPCLHCHTLTHRRCARCRTVYICSHDCQVATLMVHRPTCLEIYAERQAKKGARIEK